MRMSIFGQDPYDTKFFLLGFSFIYQRTSEICLFFTAKINVRVDILMTKNIGAYEIIPRTSEFQQTCSPKPKMKFVLFKVAKLCSFLQVEKCSLP